LVTKVDYTQTYRQTDATEYMISRRRTAGGWYNDKRSRV